MWRRRSRDGFAPQNDHSQLKYDNDTPYFEYLRKEDEPKPSTGKQPTCEQLGRTIHTPFVAILLLKESGRFLGMGSIVGRKAIITASLVVDKAMRHPGTVLVLGGRLSPWWGKDSQVSPAKEILQNPQGLAVVVLKHPFRWNKNIRPIRVPKPPVPDDFNEVYDLHWAIFGIPRSSWNVPGEPVSKTAYYVMRVETYPFKDARILDCMKTYPDFEYDASIMTCTIANVTFCWGTLGSPLVGVELATDTVYQIGVLVKTTTSDTEKYHYHIKLGYFERWVTSFK